MAKTSKPSRIESPVTTFKTFWCNEATRALDGKYLIGDHAKFGAIAKRLLDELGIDDLRSRAIEYMKDMFWLERGLPIEGFEKSINRWTTGAAKARATISGDFDTASDIDHARGMEELHRMLAESERKLRDEIIPTLDDNEILRRWKWHDIYTEEAIRRGLIH